MNGPDKNPKDQLLPYARDLFEENKCKLAPKEPYYKCEDIINASDKCNEGRRGDMRGWLPDGRSFGAETISITEYDDIGFKRNSDQFSAIDCNEDVSFAVIENEPAQVKKISEYLDDLGYLMKEKPTYQNEIVSAYKIKRKLGKCLKLDSSDYIFLNKKENILGSGKYEFFDKNILKKKRRISISK
ncbi:MAG: hypothetical protein ACFFDN_22845 [Candidatus Hodarchaeota archaeon]